MVLGVVAVLAGLALLSHVGPFRFLLDIPYRNSIVWRMPATDKTLYLTFDDGPNPTATPELLDMLRDNNVKATFFLIDEYVTEETAPIVRRMFDEGHAVAQHTGQRWLLVKSPGAMADKLTAAAAHIERLAGRRPCRLFRPHAGWRSVPMFEGAQRAGYKLVGWTWRNFDWVGFRKRTAERVAKQLIEHAAPGNIIVIHDGHHKNPRADRRYAIEATRRVIHELRPKGYGFSTLCSSSD